MDDAMYTFVDRVPTQVKKAAVPLIIAATAQRSGIFSTPVAR